MPEFKLTDKQVEANAILAGPATNIMLFGGSRSGKTFLIVRAIIIRALTAHGSRHAIFRYRFNSVKISIGMDTLPKVMQLCFPDVAYKIDKTDWFVMLPNGSEIWLGGLDDKERTEKILGQEHVTLYFNECSQIAKASRDTAMSRLAQKVRRMDGRILRRRAYYDCNPSSKNHWTYKLFIAGLNAETGMPLKNSADYASLQMNPSDNRENLPDGYIEDTLESLPARKKLRFLHGEYSSGLSNALWTETIIDKYREIGNHYMPDMQRIVVGVDPSGASDDDASDHDAIGIVVAGLGTDGNCYVLEDCTVSGGPATWGKVVTDAFARHDADIIVGESNYGGAMVQHVIQTSHAGISYKAVTATRGKVLRAEPVSALYEQGRVRHVGTFSKLEDELCSFSTVGYTGEGSPNRADALVWCVTELFPGVVRPRKRKKLPKMPRPRASVPGMGI